MKTIGIAAHSAEGGALCFQTVCREGESEPGSYLHPPVVMSCVPMGLSMEAWRRNDHDAIAEHLLQGIEQVALAGADFFVCPDNTAHIVLEQRSDQFEIPGLHIAHVVCDEISRRGWERVGLLGTDWTMTGPVYEQALASRGLSRLIPDEATRRELDRAIFEELCRGVFLPATVERYRHAIEDLKAQGAECVILGCTEIPLIINDENSPLPVLDSTRLLARAAVREAKNDQPVTSNSGWLGRAS
jgi:aspartate racemase